MLAYPSGVRKALILNLFISISPVVYNAFSAAITSPGGMGRAATTSLMSMMPGGPAVSHSLVRRDSTAICVVVGMMHLRCVQGSKLKELSLSNVEH